MTSISKADPNLQALSLTVTSIAAISALLYLRMTRVKKNGVSSIPGPADIPLIGGREKASDGRKPRSHHETDLRKNI